MKKNFDDFLIKYHDDLEPKGEENEFSNLFRTLTKMTLKVLKLYHQWLHEDDNQDI